MKCSLKVLIPFTDKITGEHYKIGTILTVEKGRSEELLSDPRELVKLVEKSVKKVTNGRASVKTRG